MIAAMTGHLQYGAFMQLSQLENDCPTFEAVVAMSREKSEPLLSDAAMATSI
jgi:hypothetical protein